MQLKNNKCSIYLLLSIMIFSQNVSAFSGLAEGIWRKVGNAASLLIVSCLIIRSLIKAKNHLNAVLFYTVYVSCIITTMIVYKDTSGEFWILCFTIAFLFVMNYDMRDALEKFVRIMYWICTIDLIGYALVRVYPEICMRYFYRLLVQMGIIFDHAPMIPYYLAGVVPVRAYAFYREPGVYQMFVIAALVLEFCLYSKVSRKRLIVLVLAVLSTYSKTGYICLVLVLLGGAIINWNKDKALRNLFLLGGIACIPIMPRFLYIIIRAFVATGADSHSWMSRLASVLVNIYLYLQNPIVGVSIGGVFENFAKITKDIFRITAGIYDVTDDTNTVLLNFASFGTVLGVMFLVAQWKCIKILTRQKYARCLFFLALVFLYAGEAVNSTVFPYIICFIGISPKCRREIIVGEQNDVSKKYLRYDVLRDRTEKSVLSEKAM